MLLKTLILFSALVVVSGYLPQTAEEEGPFQENNETYVALTPAPYVKPVNQPVQQNITIESKTPSVVLVSSGSNLGVNLFLIVKIICLILLNGNQIY